MRNTRGLSRLGQLLIAVVVLAIGGASYHLFTRQRSELPAFPDADATADGSVGRIERMTGGGAMKPGTQASEKALAPNVAFPVGAEFRIKTGGTAEIMTYGNWQIVLDEGEFAIEDARRAADQKAHSQVWTVRRGMIRAKPHDFDPADHWLEIRTPKARIYVHQGEIGARISEGGAGTVWLVKGQAEVVWEDGRRRKLAPDNSLEYL
jgi:hypothetical protein